MLLANRVGVRGNCVLCFSLDSRVRGNDVWFAGMTWWLLTGPPLGRPVCPHPNPLPPSVRGDGFRERGCFCDCGVVVGGGVAVTFEHPLRASPASPSLREGEENGVLCFSLGSRVRGNDVWLAGMTWWTAGMT